MTKLRFHLLLSFSIILGSLMLIVPFGFACAPTLPPVAAFSADPASGAAPLEVRFSDQSTGTVDALQWDFDNDGTTDSTDRNPSHVYDTSGSYTVSLKVTGPGGSDTAITTITVSPAPPQAAFTADPGSGHVPLQVQFTDRSSGEITSWNWDFNNDSTTDSTDRSPSHVYETSGSYTVSLEVTGPGGSDIEIQAISVSPAPPRAAFTANPRSGEAPLQVQFTDASNGDITSWAWDFNNDDTTDSTDRNPSYVYQSPGSYTVSLRVIGPNGSDARTEADFIVAVEKVVTIGVLADFSGAASFAMVPAVDAFEEAIRFYEEQSSIAGMTFRFVHYDHHLDYSKVVSGYQYLKANGMDVLYVVGSVEKDLLQSYLETDRMPCIGGTGRTDTLAFPWAWSSVPTLTWQSEAAMQWIAETWDYTGTGRPPKIGHQGWALSTTDEIQEGIDNVRNNAAYAGKFTWIGEDKASMTNAAWSASYAKFKDCDYVFVSTVGNSLSTFVGQMRALGYKGSFISGCDQFTGYWKQVQSNTPSADLYGCYYTWWGPIVGSGSDADWYQNMTATTKSNHTDWATRLSTTGPMSGWLNGYVMYDVIYRAAQDVGPDNINGDAIKAALDATQIDFAETGNTYQFSTTNNTGLWTLRVAHWNVEGSNWEITTGKWYAPVSLP